MDGSENLEELDKELGLNLEERMELLDEQEDSNYDAWRVRYIDWQL